MRHKLNRILILLFLILLLNNCNLNSNSCGSYEGNYKCTQSPKVKVEIKQNQDGSYLMTMNIYGMMFKFQGKCDGNKLIMNMDGQNVEIGTDSFYASGFEFSKIK